MVRGSLIRKAVSRGLPVVCLLGVSAATIPPGAGAAPAPSWGQDLSAGQLSQLSQHADQRVIVLLRDEHGDLSGAADFFAERGSMARPMAPDQIIEGRETIRASLLTRPQTLLTKHLASNVMIEVESRDAARGVSCLTIISTTPPPGAKPPFISQGPLWFGEFQDRYVRENGVWKFLERRGSIQMRFSGAAPA